MTNPENILDQSLRSEECLQLSFSRPSGRGAERIQRVTVRPIDLRGRRHYQFAARIGPQERHENLLPDEAADRAAQLFPREFLDVHLFTIEGDYSLKSRDDGTLRVRRSPPTKRPAKTSHDRARQYLIPEGVPCPFLIEIGVMTPAGKVKADMQHKFRQINRFLEFVDDVLPHLPAEGTLNLVDFGCGKSYLTFAVHHLLTQVRGRTVDIAGLDRNPHVISECSRVARELGCQGLAFHEGDIASHAAAGKVHLAISLHACDTATDTALARSVAWQADAILAAPCCQHELARIIQNSELAPLLRHGIGNERFAALATDALRAETLEACGYRTQLIEFVDLEHTPKNLLLRALRRPELDAERAAHAAAAVRMKQMLGISTFALDRELERFGCAT